MLSPGAKNQVPSCGVRAELAAARSVRVEAHATYGDFAVWFLRPTAPRELISILWSLVLLSLLRVAGSVDFACRRFPFRVVPLSGRGRLTRLGLE